MANSGFQLTTFLYGLYAGRRKLPAPPSPLPERDVSQWALGTNEGTLNVSTQCTAVQVDGTTCGSASLALAKASDPRSVEAEILNRPSQPASKADFDQLQLTIKDRTNRRKWFLAWPKKYGTPPWGASREMHFAGHDYYDRMVVDTSLPQSTRVLTHAARCAVNGFPVLLFVGGDTSRGWDAGVPRHVVVLHSPPTAPEPQEPGAQEADADSAPEADRVELEPGQTVEQQMELKLAELEAKIKAKLTDAKKAATGEEFNPEFLIYEPSRGENHKVTLQQLIDHKTPTEAFGGWNHVMWAVMPRPDAA